LSWANIDKIFKHLYIKSCVELGHLFGHVQHVVDSLESSFRILKLKHKEKNCKKGLKIAENKNEIIFFFF